MRIAIAGGTGTVGRKVVAAVTTAGHIPVVLSRASGVDLMTGTGLAPLLAGVDSVIDVSATSSIKTAESVRFFGTVTHILLDAEAAAGVGHHVALSIIGAAKINTNYYAGKVVQEQILTARADGWSLLRTTQFHEFAAQMIDRGKIGPFLLVPRMRSQPIAASEVAAELVAIASGSSRGLEPDLAGPQEEQMADIIDLYLRETRTSGRVVQVPLPGRWGRGMSTGTLLPAPGTRLGQQTFAEWLRAITR